jgi:hypothetical protein
MIIVMLRIPKGTDNRKVFWNSNILLGTENEKNLSSI